jgi:hypothetical protein
MIQQAKHTQRPASSPSRPGAEGTEGSGSHRGLQRSRPTPRRWSECRKSPLTPRFDRLGRRDRGGSCVQEEGSYGYEYASNHQGSESGKPEAHVEAAVLYQPLQESGGEVEAKAKAALRLCQDAAGGAGKVEACARYASIFGKIGHWVDKHIIKPVEHFVHEIVTNLPRCYPNEIEGGGQCSSAPPGYGDDPFYPVF